MASDASAAQAATATATVEAKPASPEQTPPGYERPKPGADRAALRPHDLVPLRPSGAAGEAGNMDLLLDVSVPVVAQLGATEMRIREILRLAPGAVVELDKLAGEPVDLFVRGQLFAQGEVVIVDDSFGIRVTKILNPNEHNEPGANA